MSIICRSTRSRPSSGCAPAGLLLVEAALAAAVIGVGLVFISRAYTSTMRVLQAARLSDAALTLAQQKLAELELEPSPSDSPALRSPRQGTFAKPHEAFEWAVTLQPDLEDPALEAGETAPMMVWITVEVADTRQGSSVRVRLTTMVPQAWIPEDWRS